MRPKLSKAIAFVLLSGFMGVVGNAQDSTNVELFVTIDSLPNYKPPIQRTLIKIEYSPVFNYNKPNHSVRFILDGEPDTLRNFFLFQSKVNKSEFSNIEKIVRSKYKQAGHAHARSAIGVIIIRNFKEEIFLFYDEDSIKDLLDEISEQFKNSENSGNLDFHLNQILSIYHRRLDDTR